MANSVFVCAECQQKTKGLKYTYNGRNYCYDCYTKMLKVLEKENTQKQHLYDYIKEIYGINEVPLEVTNMINHELTMGKKIKGIEYTLYYYAQIEGNSLGPVTSLYFIIRDYYEAAHSYVLKTKKQQEQNAQVNLNVKPRVIHLKKSDLESKNDGHHNTIKYNIEDL